MTPGKEGYLRFYVITQFYIYFIKYNLKKRGTWLGLSRLGKIGVLLNLDRVQHGFEENKEGRGGCF